LNETDIEKIETILPALLTSLEKWIGGTDFEKIMSEYNKKTTVSH
jgi:hypothetical protein